MKKLMTGLCLTLLSMTVLTACGGGQQTSTGSNPAPETSTEAPKQEKVQVNLWHAWGGSSQEIMDQLIENYNASQDQVEVTATFQGSYGDLSSKLQTAIAAGNQPEAAILERSTIINFARAGALEDLNQYDVDMSDFIPGLLSSTTYDGALVSIPAGRSMPILYYNKEHFKEVGLDPESPPATLEELKEYAERLTIPGERVGYESPTGIWNFSHLVMTYGGRLVNEEATDIGFADGAGVQALSLWNSMLKAGTMKAPPPAEADVTTLRDFVSGRVSMVSLSTGGLTIVMNNVGDAFEFGTAFMPSDNGHLVVPTGGADIAMMANSSQDKKDAMMDFVQWVTSTEQNVFISKSSGYVPTRFSAVESEEMQALYLENPLYKVAVDQLPYANDTDIYVNWSQVSREITQQVELNVLDGSIDEETAIRQIQEAVSPLFNP